MYTNDGMSVDVDASFPPSTGLEQVTFPGWVVTAFDEHNVFAGDGASSF